jgi:hypothetical protein
VDPERFDAARRMERHLGLGHGVHVCIGAHVARLEGTVMLQELLALPGLRGRRHRPRSRGVRVPCRLGRDARRGALKPEPAARARFSAPVTTRRCSTGPPARRRSRPRTRT